MSQSIGRVKSWNRAKGYGFIFIGDDYPDMYFNASDLAGEYFNVVIGDIVCFDIANNRIGKCANNVTLLEAFDEETPFQIGEYEFPIRAIRGIGICSSRRALDSIGVTEEELVSHGHTLSEVEYLFISTGRGEYRFFNEGSCVHGDGQLDVHDAYEQICNALYRIPDEYWRSVEAKCLNEDQNGIKVENTEPSNISQLTLRINQEA